MNTQKSVIPSESEPVALVTVPASVVRLVLEALGQGAYAVELHRKNTGEPSTWDDDKKQIDLAIAELKGTI
jgi:hypothetical protein